MPVDLLEGNAGNAGARRRVLAGPVYGHASLLTLVCANFELALQAACVVAIFMFVPVEMLSESLRAAWALIGTAVLGGPLVDKEVAVDAPGAAGKNTPASHGIACSCPGAMAPRFILPATGTAFRRQKGEDGSCRPSSP